MSTDNDQELEAFKSRIDLQGLRPRSATRKTSPKARGVRRSWKTARIGRQRRAVERTSIALFGSVVSEKVLLDLSLRLRASWNAADSVPPSPQLHESQAVTDYLKGISTST